MRSTTPSQSPVIGLYKTKAIRRRGAVAHARGRGIRHAGVGRLVQHAAVAGTDWRRAAGGV